MAEHDQQFDTFTQWVNKASSWLTRRDDDKAICYDSMGRSCRQGSDFARARDEGTFPVRWTWASEVGSMSMKQARILGSLLEATEVSGMSWSGFNIVGDRKSIDEVRRMENISSQVEVYRTAFQERIATLTAERDALRERIVELEMDNRDFKDLLTRKPPEKGNRAKVEFGHGALTTPAAFCEDEGCPQFGTKHICVSAAQAENEKLREDAERYRWLRQQSRKLWTSIGWNTWEDHRGVPEFIWQCRDKEIDTARTIPSETETRDDE